MPDYSPDTVARKIVSVVEDGNCAAWIGSGLSQPIFRSWPELVADLCDSCGVPQLPESVNDPKRLISKAEECKRTHPPEYHQVLRNTYDRQHNINRDAYALLLQLPFARLITTNFDRLLSRACQVRGGHDHRLFYYPILEPTDTGQPVYYIHGHPETIEPDGTTHFVLAESEFEEAYESPASPLPDFIRQVLRFKPVLFLGCELKEPSIEETFDRVRQFHEEVRRIEPGRSVPPRCILRPMLARRQEALGGLISHEERDFEREREEAERFSELAIKVIRYQPLDDEHSGLEQVLMELRDLLTAGPVPRISATEEYPS